MSEAPAPDEAADPAAPDAGEPGDGAVPTAIAALGFEEALAELEKIVRDLESGQAKLDEAIAAYERGAALRQHCEARLREAQAKVDRIVAGPDGQVGLEPAGLDEA